MKNLFKKNDGAALVTLLVFMIVASAVMTSAVAVIINTTQSSSILGSSVEASAIAESGIENALLRTLRDPTYNGETLPVGDGSAVITVSGTFPKTITSVGTVGNFKKTVQVVVTYNTIMSVTSWQYIY